MVALAANDVREILTIVSKLIHVHNIGVLSVIHFRRFVPTIVVIYYCLFGVMLHLTSYTELHVEVKFGQVCILLEILSFVDLKEDIPLFVINVPVEGTTF